MWWLVTSSVKKINQGREIARDRMWSHIVDISCGPADSWLIYPLKNALSYFPQVRNPREQQWIKQQSPTLTSQSFHSGRRQVMYTKNRSHMWCMSKYQGKNKTRKKDRNCSGWCVKLSSGLEGGTKEGRNGRDCSVWVCDCWNCQRVLSKEVLWAFQKNPEGVAGTRGPGSINVNYSEPHGWWEQPG